MLGTAPMSLSTAFSPSFAPMPFRPTACPGASLQHVGAFHSPASPLAPPSARKLPALRSSSPTSFSPGAMGDVAEVEGSFWMFAAWASLMSGLEHRLLSLHDRLSRKRFGRVTAAAVVLGLLVAMLRAAVGATAGFFGAMARFALVPQAAEELADAEEAEFAGEAPPLRELRAEHLAAARFGEHGRATRREAEAMGVVRDRVLALSDAQRLGMDQAWVDALTPVDLLRYVRGNGGQGGRAADKLLGTAVWRKEYGVAGILDEEDTTIDAFFADKTHEVDWLAEGADLEGGRPSLLYRSAVHHPSDIPTDRWVRFFVHQCEWARVRYPNDQVLVLVDRVGSGLSNQDPTVLRALAPVIVDHYPDTIGRVVIAPVNKVLYVIWGLVSLILDATTKSRMKLLKGADWKHQLTQCMDAGRIPERLGGTNTEL